MTRDELVTVLAGRLDAPIHSTRVFLHAFFDVAKSMLRNGESVEIGNLGVWEPEISENGELVAVRYLQPIKTAKGVGVWSYGQRYILPPQELHVPLFTDLDMVDIAEIVSEVTARAGWSDEPTVRNPRQGPTQDADIPVLIPEEPEFSAPAEWENDPSLSELLEEMQAEAGKEVELAFEPSETAPEQESDIEDFFDDHPAGAPPDETTVDPRGYPVSDAPPQSERSASDLLSVQEMHTGQPLPVLKDSQAVPEKGVAEEREHEDFEDDDSFFRNRDQLYNPPENKSNRSLALVAIVLTAILIAIILYYILTDDPVHELPGVDAPTGALLLSRVTHS